MNGKSKSIVTNDGLVILIKAVTTGIGSQHWYIFKAFLRKLAQKDRKILFFLEKKLPYLNVKLKSLFTNDGVIFLIEAFTTGI